jgi:hypothetical protein
LQKEVFINDIRVSVDGEERWGWIWMRNLFAWEHELLHELLVEVPMVPPSVEKDEWYWRPGEGGIFTVNSAYKFLGGLFSEDSSFSPNELRVFKNI